MAVGCPASRGSICIGLLLGEPTIKPCCVRKLTRFGELGGLGNSNGGIVCKQKKQQSHDSEIVTIHMP